MFLNIIYSFKVLCRLSTLVFILSTQISIFVGNPTGFAVSFPKSSTLGDAICKRMFPRLVIETIRTFCV